MPPKRSPPPANAPVDAAAFADDPLSTAPAAPQFDRQAAVLEFCQLVREGKSIDDPRLQMVAGILRVDLWRAVEFAKLAIRVEREWAAKVQDQVDLERRAEVLHSQLVALRHAKAGTTEEALRQGEESARVERELTRAEADAFSNPTRVNELTTLRNYAPALFGLEPRPFVNSWTFPHELATFVLKHEVDASEQYGFLKEPPPPPSQRKKRKIVNAPGIEPPRAPFALPLH